MRHPGQNLSQIANHQPGRQVWPADHHHRQVQLTRGSKLGHGTGATGVFGHHMSDPMALQQFEIATRSNAPRASSIAQSGSGHSAWGASTSRNR